MATTRKILGQHIPAATATELMYTVPASTQTVISSIVCCNTSSAADVFSIAVVPSGGSVTPETIIYYSLPLGYPETFTATIGITMNSGDMIYVYSLSGGISFSAFGQEIT